MYVNACSWPTKNTDCNACAKQYCLINFCRRHQLFRAVQIGRHHFRLGKDIKYYCAIVFAL